MFIFLSDGFIWICQNSFYTLAAAEMKIFSMEKYEGNLNPPESIEVLKKVQTLHLS